MLRTLKHSFFARLRRIRRSDTGVLIVRGTLLGAALVCLICHSSWSAENQKQNAGQPAQITKPDLRGTKQSPFVVETLPSEHAYTKTAEEEQHEQNKADDDRLLARSTFALAIITFALALFTLGLMIFTGKLWLATGKLVKDAEEISERQGRDTRESLRIAKISADVAKQSADTAERALFHLERPYLFIDLSRPAFYEGAFPSGTRFINNGSGDPVTYWLYNAGRTPAILTHIRHEIVLTDSNDVLPPAIDPGIRQPGDDLPEGLAVEKELQQTVPFKTPPDKKTTTHGTYLIGFVRYRDIFKKRHIIGFCARLDERYRFVQHSTDRRYNYTRDEGEETPS